MDVGSKYGGLLETTAVVQAHDDGGLGTAVAEEVEGFRWTEHLLRN